ncbi:hypothetical protein [[Clostridium] fimetarium]|uniref:Uncharacterized protein n=1 Tax=[Clostridium] fimetarium TaxID=99656 RepID=A0A1I0PG68_9FIRM|nr:hypothetical protein [[Clostridium] fimetarium]SEW13430.1 hypothetical protein SAMN05421659_10567 [[Clostridium] fimetarium]
MIIEKTVHSLKRYKWYMKKKFAKECCRINLLEVIYNRYYKYERFVPMAQTWDVSC